MGQNRRVVHKEHGAGEIRQHTFIGQVPVALVKFDSQEDEIFVPENELDYEIKKGVTISAEMEKELEEIRAVGLKEVKEIEGMNDETLVEAFEYLIRNGAGPEYRRVVFMKRDMLRRMKKTEKEEDKSGI